jgi:hypothetical protein
MASDKDTTKPFYLHRLKGALDAIFVSDPVHRRHKSVTEQIAISLKPFSSGIERMAVVSDIILPANYSASMNRHLGNYILHELRVSSQI